MSKKQKKHLFTKEEKIKIWDEMNLAYIKDGVIALQDIKRQRDTVVDNLNSC